MNKMTKEHFLAFLEVMNEYGYAQYCKIKAEKPELENQTHAWVYLTFKVDKRTQLSKMLFDMEDDHEIYHLYFDEVNNPNC